MELIEATRRLDENDAGDPDPIVQLQEQDAHLPYDLARAWAALHPEAVGYLTVTGAGKGGGGWYFYEVAQGKVRKSWAARCLPKWYERDRLRESLRMEQIPPKP